jgi:hypothetical protein
MTAKPSSHPRVRAEPAAFGHSAETPVAITLQRAVDLVPRGAGDGIPERSRQGVENVAGFFDVLARWTSPDLPVLSTSPTWVVAA